MANKFDELLTRLGTGKWNFLYFASACYWIFLIPPQAFSVVYLAPNMNHTCIPPTLDDPVTIDSDSCNYFVNVTGELQQFPCTEFEYDRSVYENTLTSEFHLVCDRSYLRATYQSLYMFGLIFSSVGAGYIADRFGRKKVVLVTQVAHAGLAFAMGFLNNFSVILFFRFIMGCVGVPTLYTLSFEVCEIKHRGTVGMLTGMPWALGTMAWGGIAYFIRDWRWLQASVTVPFAFLIPALILMNESPRWLIVRGHYDQAIKVVQRAARWNKTELPPTDELQKLMVEIREELNQSENVSKKTENRGWKWLVPTICSTRSIRIIISLFTLNLFICELVFSGLSLSATVYSADPFLYIVIGGIMELPGYTLTAPLINRVGRKWPPVWGFTITGIVILLLIFIPKNISWLVMTLAMLAKLTLSGAYMIIHMSILEVLPTEVRVQGVGITTNACQVGGIIAAYIIDYLGPSVPWAPSFIFGVASLIAAVGMLPVPETMNKPLPDTVHDLKYISLVPRFLRKRTERKVEKEEEIRTERL